MEKVRERETIKIIIKRRKSRNRGMKKNIYVGRQDKEAIYGKNQTR